MTLGTGYVKTIANTISKKQNGKQTAFFNRGIGGNKVKDLKDRWKRDCINLEPDVVSILIGINDVVGRYPWSRVTSTKSFEADYRTILKQTKDFLSAKIVLLTPFIESTHKSQIIQKILLQEKIKVVKSLSEEFNAFLIPMDQIFANAVKSRALAYWSTDGIHPTAIGHSLIAQSWLKLTSLTY